MSFFIQSPFDFMKNAQRALQNAQSKDMSSLLNELNDKRARLDEIDIFLGRVEDSSPAVERAKARYGDEYYQIIVDKINKESEQSGGSDIVFAPKREKFGIMSSEDLTKLDKMPVEKSGESGKMNLNEFLNDKGEVDYAKLEKIAIDLSSKLSYKGFLRQFENSNKVIIKTPIKDLEVNPRYMFFHLTKYGDKQSKIKGNGKENRLWLNGGVLETLQNPLFVTQGADETYYFYKAFKNDKGLINLVSIAVPKNNSQMLYKTSYDGTHKRILDLVKEYKTIYKASYAR